MYYFSCLRVLVSQKQFQEILGLNHQLESRILFSKSPQAHGHVFLGTHTHTYTHTLTQALTQRLHSLSPTGIFTYTTVHQHKTQIYTHTFPHPLHTRSHPGTPIYTHACSCTHTHTLSHVSGQPLPDAKYSTMDSSPKVLVA